MASRSETLQLQLYSTSHCHLCEQAEDLLRLLAAKAHFSWQTLEITDDADLLSQYEISIPVLKRLDTHAELSWPFSEQDVLNFLEL